MTGWQRWIAIALLVCAAVAPRPVSAQPGRLSGQPAVREGYAPVQMSATPEQSQTGRMCIAIVGSVASPATYEVEASSTATDLLKAAGGLSQDASENLLIVRQGRINGPILFDPKDPDLTHVGALLDGDVLVIRSRRGVRTAHFQSVDGAVGAADPREVVHASVARPIHVACIGLDRHPIVLPLPAEKASERVLLLDLLRIQPTVAEQGVRRVSEALQATNNGQLLDGTVLYFDPRVVTPGTLSPVEPFPRPRVVPAPSATNNAPMTLPHGPAGQPINESLSAEQLPVEQLAQTTTVEPQPVAEPLVTPIPHTPMLVEAPSRLPSGQSQPEPLPGFPFVVRDAVVSITETPHSGDSSPEHLFNRFHPAEVVRGGAPVDITAEAEVAPARLSSTVAPASLQTTSNVQTLGAIETTEEGPIGIRAPAVAIHPRIPASPIAELDAPSSTEAATAIEAKSQRGFDLSVIIGILIGTCGCLLVYYFLVYSPTPAMHHSTAEQPRSVSQPPSSYAPVSGRGHDTATNSPVVAANASLLSDLLSNKLPVIEVPTAVSPPPRLFGPVVGGKRMMIDAPHPQVAGPHFSVGKDTDGQRQTGRLERHLTAITSRPPRRTDRSEGSRLRPDEAHQQSDTPVTAQHVSSTSERQPVPSPTSVETNQQQLDQFVRVESPRSVVRPNQVRPNQVPVSPIVETERRSSGQPLTERPIAQRSQERPPTHQPESVASGSIPFVTRSAARPTSTFGYDIVQPDVASTPPPPQPTARHRVEQGELLTRVLDSLRGEP